MSQAPRSDGHRFNLSFTLVELMIVVAIIALLAAIAVPLTANYMLKARAAEVATNADGLMTAGWACEDLIPGNTDFQLTAFPRTMAQLDKTAVPWTGAPAGWSTVPWAPDGNVRCNYGIEIAQPGPSVGVPRTTIIAGGMCDIDDDNNAYYYGLRQGDVDTLTELCTSTMCNRSASCMCY